MLRCSRLDIALRNFDLVTILSKYRTGVANSGASQSCRIKWSIARYTPFIY